MSRPHTFFRNLWFLALLGLSAQCDGPAADALPADQLYTSIPASRSGLNFRNDLHYDRKFNIYTYRNFYNGGGVALGDVNGDGWVDVYFTANMESNRLFLNRGDFQFEEVTEAAGVGGTRAWSTGVAMADVNADGLLDIYVCNSGDISGDNKQNELFLNQGPDENGVPRFEEAAEALGLADRGFSTHAAFFDYDRDGDLDLYLLNNSYRAIGSFNLRENERPIRDEVGGDKLFRNDGGTFTDVSEAAGIYGSIIGFGLGVTVGDVNRDGWSDIYVSNDFFERDYLYLNQQDGSFRESLTEAMRSISAASMGADMADLNQDGYPEIFVTDMLPEPDARIKQVTMFEDWTKYQLNLKYDYYHQFSRNMLHLNLGDSTFSEVGRMLGVEATDWSWGALLFDMDNDGLRDIFVANGIYQDLTDLDYINFIANSQTQKEIVAGGNVDYRRLIDSIPVRPVPNYAFHNQGYEGESIRIPRFENRAADFGLDQPSFSNGSAYGDLDNDGDLDLVVNNVNMEAFLYRNNTDQLHPERHWLRLQLEGKGDNPFALGTQITAVAGEERWFSEHMPMRGFQSTMDPRPLLGLGAVATLDSLLIRWPDGAMSVVLDVPTNQEIALRWAEASGQSVRFAPVAPPSQGLFRLVETDLGLDYQHQENDFNDFNRDPLLYHMLSQEGPCAATGDVNGDGREDLFIGGSKGQAAVLYLQTAGGGFRPLAQPAFVADRGAEDVDCVLFDADNDGDLDLYVASGGSEFGDGATELRDRLYLNNGHGRFSASDQVLPAGRLETSACVHAADFDNDGDQDLLVGIRLRPFLYGVPVNAYLLQNDGNGRFTNVTADKAPELLELGLYTDLRWADVDGDGDPDLMVLGEWMAPTLFLNDKGQLRKAEDSGLEDYTGWWTCLQEADLDGDGDLDFVLGNHGLNSRFEASPERPIEMFVNDFDGNGRAEQIMARYVGDSLKPYVRKPDLTMQMPGLKRKYLRFSNYVNETMVDIFGQNKLDQSVHWQVSHLANSIALNQGDGRFELKTLPPEAQLSPVYGISVDDYNEDGHPDLLVGGNYYAAKPEVGRYDASYGLLMLGDGTGQFQPLRAAESGFKVDGQVRELLPIRVGSVDYLLAVRNQASVQIFQQE